MKLPYLLIACIFLGASLYTMLTCKTCSPFKDYKDSLTQEQKDIYEEITSERISIYLKGLVLGSIVSMLYLYHNHDSINVLKHSVIFTAIALSVQYMVYTLHPKSKWMLNNIDSREQIDGWLEVYKFMKTRYHVGMLLGIIGYWTMSFGLILN